MSKKAFTFDNRRLGANSAISRIDKFMVSQDLNSKGENWAPNHNQEILGSLTPHHLHLGAGNRHRQASVLLRHLLVGGREEQGSPTPSLGRRLTDPTQRPGLGILDWSSHKKGNDLQQPPCKGKKTPERCHDQISHWKDQVGGGSAIGWSDQWRSKGHPARLPGEVGRGILEPSVAQPAPILRKLVYVRRYLLKELFWLPQTRTEKNFAERVRNKERHNQRSIWSLPSHHRVLLQFLLIGRKHISRALRKPRISVGRASRWGPHLMWTRHSPRISPWKRFTKRSRRCPKAKCPDTTGFLLSSSKPAPLKWRQRCSKLTRPCWPLEKPWITSTWGLSPWFPKREIAPNSGIGGRSLSWGVFIKF